MDNISLLLPCKNDEKIIHDNILPLIKFLNSNLNNFEILIISNGSNKNNLSYLLKMKDFDKRIKYHILDKKGKGRAIRFGLNNSQYENVLLFDSDFAYDFHDIKNFITEDTSLTPFLVGTRYLDQNDKTSKTRKLFGKIYNKIFNFLFQKNLPDTQAGFKLINIKKFEAAKYIKLNNFSYDVELFILAYKNFIKIKRIPIKVKNNNGNTSINLLLTPIRMLLDLLYLKFKYKNF